MEEWEKQEKEKIEKQKEKGEITDKEYEAKKKNIELIRKGQQLSKVTVGIGYTDVDLYGLKKDKENIYPEEHVSYIADSRTQLILCKDEKTENINTEFKTVAMYTDGNEIEHLIDIDTSEIEYEENEYDEEEYEENEEYYNEEEEWNGVDEENEYEEDDEEIYNDEEYEYNDEEYERILDIDFEEIDIDPYENYGSISKKLNQAMYEFNQKHHALTGIREELKRIRLEEIRKQIGDRKLSDLNKIVEEITGHIKNKSRENAEHEL